MKPGTFGALAMLALGSIGSAPGLELVKEGRPVAVVVTTLPAEQWPGDRAAPGFSEAGERAALRVLVEWIGKITDARLTVTNASGPGAAIYLGQAAVAAGLDLETVRSPSREGLRVVADDRRVLIAGQSEAATLKAVCRFLETLGCRYFMDGPLGEVYPRTATLEVGALDLVEQPGLLGRNPKGPSWRAALWKSWNGAGGEVYHHEHAWGRYVTESVFEEHPEFFAMDDQGQRKRGPWLCTSNPELRHYFAGKVIAAIRKGTIHPSLSPPDGRGYCRCPACRAQDDPRSIEPSSGALSVSARYVDFFNDVAGRVGAACPGSVLSFYCYADYTQAPSRGFRLATNLCPVIAPIRYCRLHGIGNENCPSRQQQTAMVEGWAAAAARLGYYNYMYNLADATLPCFKFTACREEFRYLREKGLSSMTLEMLSNWHIYGPQMYLSLRLAYDPQADAQAIIEDYWTKFYGPRAAPFMKQYWMGIDAALGRLKSHAGGFFGLAQIYTPEFLQRCRELLGQAGEATREDPVYAQRVTLHSQGFQSAVNYRQICQAMQQGDFAQARSVLDRMQARLQSLSQSGWANPEYGTAYLDRFLRPIVHAADQATGPPHRLLQVLPDPWRLALDLDDSGRKQGWFNPAFDHSQWAAVSTLGTTLDTQGFNRNAVLWYRTTFQVPTRHGPLSLFFCEVDGWTEVYLNGHLLKPRAATVGSAPASAGNKSNDGQRARPRHSFETDLGAAVRQGENVLALRVDHTAITELALGGLLRPVLLIERVE